MSLVEVVARIASTHPVEKYRGVRLSEGALRQFKETIEAGGLPMNFDHSSLNPIEARFLSARIVDLDDGELALEATFEVDAEAWKEVEDRWDGQGCPVVSRTPGE